MIKKMLPKRKRLKKKKLLRRRKQLRRKTSSQAMQLTRINKLLTEQEPMLLIWSYLKKTLRRISLIPLLPTTNKQLMMLLNVKEKLSRLTITKEEEPLHKLEIH